MELLIKCDGLDYARVDFSGSWPRGFNILKFVRVDLVPYNITMQVRNYGIIWVVVGSDVCKYHVDTCT